MGYQRAAIHGSRCGATVDASQRLLQFEAEILAELRRGGLRCGARGGGVRSAARPRDEDAKRRENIRPHGNRLGSGGKVAAPRPSPSAAVGQPCGERVTSPPRPILSPSRKFSDDGFCQPEQTLFLFDWDDTLCPTSVCLQQCGMPVGSTVLDEALAADLKRLGSEVDRLLSEACALAGTVVIVTNAGQGWVQSSGSAWLPGLRREVLDSVEIASARARWEPEGLSCPTEWKAKEFESIIQRFYSRYDNQSWKNIVAVGDAEYEHDALQQVVLAAPPEVGFYCRPKSVRFIAKPSISQLTFQVRTLRETLHSITQFNGELDIKLPLHLLPED